MFCEECKGIGCVNCYGRQAAEADRKKRDDDSRRLRIVPMSRRCLIDILNASRNGDCVTLDGGDWLPEDVEIVDVRLTGGLQAGGFQVIADNGGAGLWIQGSEIDDIDSIDFEDWPVNLVVNGKLFARGELIEVDGELGVRLLKVAGN